MSLSNELILNSVVILLASVEGEVQWALLSLLAGSWNISITSRVQTGKDAARWVKLGLIKLKQISRNLVDWVFNGFCTTINLGQHLIDGWGVAVGNIWRLRNSALVSIFIIDPIVSARNGEICYDVNVELFIELLQGNRYVLFDSSILCSWLNPYISVFQVGNWVD